MDDFILVKPDDVGDEDRLVLAILQVIDGYGVSLLVQDFGAFGFADSGGWGDTGRSALDALCQYPDMTARPTTGDHDDQAKGPGAIRC